MQIFPYLVFNGDAKEAMSFYQQVLGGQLEVSHFSEMPDFEENFKSDVADRVMHAQLTCEDATLMASDSCPEQPSGPMDGFSVTIVLNDVERGAQIFETLGEGGTVIMPWAPTFWAAGFGMFKDKYGVICMINSGMTQQ